MVSRTTRMWSFRVRRVYHHLSMMTSVSLISHASNCQAVICSCIVHGGAGRSIRPKTSKDCQLPAAAAVASSLATKLKNGSVARQLTGTPSLFTEVFGISHSLGSFVLYYSTLRDSRLSPFSGIILTGKQSDSELSTIPYSHLSQLNIQVSDTSPAIYQISQHSSALMLLDERSILHDGEAWMMDSSLQPQGHDPLSTVLMDHLIPLFSSWIP